MALTLTKKESERIYSKTSRAFANAAYELHKKNKFGMELCNDMNKLKELFVYLMALASWEQAEFASNYFDNCLSTNEVYNIFSRIKELS